MSRLPVLDSDQLKAAVREYYGQAALQKTSCCGGTCGDDPITRGLYDPDQTSQIPEPAVLASLGCGNPTALAALHPGDVVLDLGSGGGIDVLLSARRVGPTGKAYGLDMTDEMLALARENARRAGATNVEFLKGDIEQIPLPDNSVDVIISNCVVNLAVDKRKVLAEAFRVLKPGGRFAVSDIVVLGEVPAEVRRSAELWMGCIAGALHAEEFTQLLREAGFTAARVEPTRVYRVADVRAEVLTNGIDLDRVADQVDGKFAAAFVRARKPRDPECVRVRAATTADRPRVTELLTGAGLPLDGIPADLAHFRVAETDLDGVIAAAGLELYGPSALLRSAVVDPAWQGSGVGTVVVEAALDAARAAGAEDVFLLTTTAADYFPKHGFVCVERSSIPAAFEVSAELRGACPDSATVMHRTLR